MVNLAELLDLLVADRSFPWSNMQERLILTTFDRVLAFANWETQVPVGYPEHTA